MPFDRGYYYRSARRDGLPRREYVGKGLLADLAASSDAAAKARKRLRASIQASERTRAEAIDRRTDELGELADLAAQAALLAAGYRQHKRGEWRKTRDRHDDAGG